MSVNAPKLEVYFVPVMFHHTMLFMDSSRLWLDLGSVLCSQGKKESKHFLPINLVANQSSNQSLTDCYDNHEIENKQTNK